MLGLLLHGVAAFCSQHSSPGRPGELPSFEKTVGRRTSLRSNSRWYCSVPWSSWILHHSNKWTAAQETDMLLLATHTREQWFGQDISACAMGHQILSVPSLKKPRLLWNTHVRPSRFDSKYMWASTLLSSTPEIILVCQATLKRTANKAPLPATARCHHKGTQHTQHLLCMWWNIQEEMYVCLKQ